MKTNNTPPTHNDVALAVIVNKAFAAVDTMTSKLPDDRPFQDKAALASVLVLMGGAPVHASSLNVIERGRAVMPLYRDIMRRANMHGITVDRSPTGEALTSLLHELEKLDTRSEAFGEKLAASFELYAIHS